MLIKRNELYNIVSSICDGEYAIGLHGINVDRLKYLNDIDDKDFAMKRIIEEGLKIFHERTIHGTVSFFGRVDLDKNKVYNGLNAYNYNSDSYVIVAIPTTLNKDGKEVYLGTPNLDSEYIEYMGTTGDYTTTLLDDFIKKDSKIPSEFILGTFKILQSGMIDLEINPNHVANNKNMLDLDKYKNDFLYLNSMLRMYGLSLDYFRRDINEEQIKFLEDKIPELESVIYKSGNSFNSDRFAASLVETIKQLLSEIKLEKVIEEVPDYTNVSNVKAELKRGEYFIYGEKYYIEFKYNDEVEEKKVFELFESIINPAYSVFSSRAKEGFEYIMPYLGRNSNVIGGTSIPEDVLIDFIKLLNDNGITIITNDNELSSLLDSDSKKLF